MEKKMFYRLVSFLLLLVGVVSVRFFIGGDYESWLKQVMGVVVFFLGAVYGYVRSLYKKETKTVGVDVE